MGFVVYTVDNKRAIGYYEREASAKSRVTRNNKAWLVTHLRGKRMKDAYYHDESAFAYCAWADYEEVVKEKCLKYGKSHYSFSL
jgi:hypothetical protein